MIIPISTIKEIISKQFPEYSNLEIRLVENNGHDNRTYHLGNALSLRFPSDIAYATQVIKEYKYCPILQKTLTLSITQPIKLGLPSPLFPYHFSINKWIEGEVATRANIYDLNLFALELAQFINGLQRCATSDGPLAGSHNFYRGGNLSIYHNETLHAIKECTLFDQNECLKIWMNALASDDYQENVWVHGDIARGNLLIKDHHLCAVIDFGSIAIGDPACDYAIAWTFFEPDSRKIFLETLNADKQVIKRARAWALWKALITLNDPTRSKDAIYTLNQILNDAHV